MNRSVKTRIIEKNNTKEYKEENKIYNLYNTDHLFRLWWTESTFPPISRANVAHAGFRAVARQQTLQWEPPKPEGFPITVLHNSANSSMRMHSVAFEHKKDPDSYLIHVCYVITIVPDCNILHVRIYFELSMKKYNILKKTPATKFACKLRQGLPSCSSTHGVKLHLQWASLYYFPTQIFLQLF